MALTVHDRIFRPLRPTLFPSFLREDLLVSYGTRTVPIADSVLYGNYTSVIPVRMAVVYSFA